MGRLLNYDPEKDKEKIQQARIELGNDMDNAESEILQIVLDKKREFDETVRNRIKNRKTNENALSFLDL